MTIIGLSNYENVIGDFMKDIKEKTWWGGGKGDIKKESIFQFKENVFHENNKKTDISKDLRNCI